MIDQRVGDGACTRWCSATSTSTTRRCCRRSQLARLSGYRRRGARAAPSARAAGGLTGPRAGRGPRRGLRAGRSAPRASPTTTSARATAPTSAASDRPHADHQRDLPDASSRAAATSGASGGRTRAGRGRRSTTSPTRAAGPPARPAAVAPGRLGAAAPRPSRSSTSPGSRPTPSPARTALGSPPRRSGRRRRPGTRRRRTARRFPWGDEPPAPGDGRANLDQTGLGPLPVGAFPAGAAPCGALGMLGATSGSGRRASSAATRASSPYPYREYSEVFFGADYRVLRGGSWATRARVATADLPQLGPPPAPPDLLRPATGEGRLTSTDTPLVVVDCHLGPRRRALAGRRRARRPHAAVQGAAAQALLRRARLGAVRAHLRAARVLPDAHRAGDPRAQRADEIVAATGAGELVELGSGSADKTRVLLDAMARGGHAAPLRPVRRLRAGGARHGGGARRGVPRAAGARRDRGLRAPPRRASRP